LPSLTGLRFIAAFAVFGFHIVTGGFVNEGPVGVVFERLFGQGSSGVSFFFILSGFVLAWSARPTDTARHFWRRRMAKIYPNHLVTWLVALGALVATSAALNATIALPNLFLLQAWVPDVSVYYGMNTVSWSLSCEAFFYALFPVLFLGLRRLPVRALWPAAIATMATIWLIPLAVQLLPEQYRYWAVWVFPVARLPEFVVGMVLARILLAGRWPRLAIWHTVVLTAIAYGGARYVPGEARIVAATAVPLALLIAAVAAADADGRSTFLRARWAVFLGEISFAFYLVHHLCLRFLAKATGTDAPLLTEIGLTVFALVLTTGLSWLLYRFVEVPAMRRFGSTVRARHLRT
jgi:peptidoglycan/LPS O-acetylase OafA/YrhL